MSTRLSLRGTGSQSRWTTGFCTGSSVTKTVFATTRVPYNVSGSRNLRIVR
jgi:hypothetical protein